ncbi:MAG: hypothetical protein NUW37_07155 [Planctomycetes bacterium]|nr:hypothetical protein [Planctomycetota bacterium]
MTTTTVDPNNMQLLASARISEFPGIDFMREYLLSLTYSADVMLIEETRERKVFEIAPTQRRFGSRRYYAMIFCDHLAHFRYRTRISFQRTKRGWVVSVLAYKKNIMALQLLHVVSAVLFFAFVSCVIFSTAHGSGSAYFVPVIALPFLALVTHNEIRRYMSQYEKLAHFIEQIGNK